MSNCSGYSGGSHATALPYVDVEFDMSELGVDLCSELPHQDCSVPGRNMRSEREDSVLYASLGLGEAAPGLPG